MNKFRGLFNVFCLFIDKKRYQNVFDEKIYTVFKEENQNCFPVFIQISLSIFVGMFISITNIPDFWKLKDYLI